MAFDIDGTLYPNSRMYLNSLLFSLPRLRFLYYYRQVRISVRSIRPIDDFRETQAGLLAELMHISTASAIKRIERAIYCRWQRIFRHIRPFPYLSDFLLRLQSHGYAIGVLSDFPVGDKLAHLNLPQVWDCVVSSEATYAEMLDEKIIVTSDGASAHVFDAKPALRMLAIAERNGDQTLALETLGVTGGWSELFTPKTPEEMADHAVQLAVEQLSAERPTGGVAQVILDPELVGVLSHEAIGHTVEADFVLGGAITAGKLGVRIASELVTMCDSGASEHAPHAVGETAVDDEGVPATRTVIIEEGVLRSYLHNRETAAHFSVPPTGNARAFTYSDEPLVRMTNTYIEPGEMKLEDLFATMGDGYYLRGFGPSGQADSNAEFMFGVREAWRVSDGRMTKRVRGVTISGNAFDTLRSVDAVADDFRWEQGAGYCGKSQPAKVDGGGPHVRCTLTIGGEQSG